VGVLRDTLDELILAADKVSELDPRACRERAERQFSHLVMAESYVRIYQNLLTSGALSRPDAATRPHHWGAAEAARRSLQRRIPRERRSSRRIGAAERIASGVGLPLTFERSRCSRRHRRDHDRDARIGIHDPGVEMLVVRLVQAAYSLLAVYFVYRLLERSMGPESAMLGGLLAAAFYAMPVTAVHQLEESACQVPLLAAFWWWQRTEDRPPTLRLLGRAGRCGAGRSTPPAPSSHRVRRRVRRARAVASAAVTVGDKLAFLGGLALVVVLQGYSNAVVNHEWGIHSPSDSGPCCIPAHGGRVGWISEQPAVALRADAARHADSASFDPPAGRSRPRRSKNPAARPRTLAFLVSHSLIANKQERFLLPILPALFILIVVGLPWLAARITRPVYRGMWWYFWTVNTVLLVIVTLSFSKKDRVEPLLIVYRRHDATGVLVAQYNQTFSVPEYYLGNPRPALAVVERGQDVESSTRGLPINYVIVYSDTRRPIACPWPERCTAISRYSR